MIIEISIALVAIAFAALVVYLILLIIALRKTLHQTDRTMVQVRKQLDELSPQAQKIIEHTNQLSFDIKRKMEALNPIFNALGNLGEMAEHKTFALKKKAPASEEDSLTEHELRSRSPVADVLELAVIGTCLWQKLKNK